MGPRNREVQSGEAPQEKSILISDLVQQVFSGAEGIDLGATIGPHGNVRLVSIPQVTKTGRAACISVARCLLPSLRYLQWSWRAPWRSADSSRSGRQSIPISLSLARHRMR